MSALAVVGSNRLPVLAASINDHLAAAEQATKRGLEHAITAGKLLLAAKELVDHGGWLSWLKANCHLSVRQAQTYMRLASQHHKLDAFKNAATAHLTIAAAEALVGKPKPEQPHGLPGQLDLLGGPEVRPPSTTATVPAISLDGAPLDLIADLERVLAFIRDEEERGGRRFWPTPQARAQRDSPSDRRRHSPCLETIVNLEEERDSRFRAAASTINATLAYLRRQR
jgi:hypothetical protein